MSIGATAGWLKNAFIPHEGNGHKPHILRPRTVAFACLILVVAEVGFLFTASYIVPKTKFFGIIDANALVDETNAARTQNGVAELNVSPLLTQAAQEKANDMVANNYFAHTSPSGLTPWYWFEQVGYAFSFAGENLAVNFTDSEDVTDAWMNSPEHRANILDNDYTQIGIATAEGTYNGQPAIYVVEEFGTPASQPIAFLNSASAAASAPQTPPSVTPATNTEVVTSTPPSLPQSGTVVVAPSTVQNVPASQQPVAPVATPASKKAAAKPPVAPKPKPVADVPAVVPTSTVPAADAQPVSIIIPAAALAAPITSAGGTATTTPPTTTAAIQGGTIRMTTPQTNVFQRLISNPTALTDDFYYLLMALFAVALVLNFFIKIRIQFPRLILSGMLVVVVAGLLILYNQDFGILHAVIL
jgi:hypothetical protein